MTESEQALLQYFYTVSKRPEIVAALPDPRRVGLAFLTCIERDLPAVLRHAFGRAVGKVEVPARFAAQAVIASALGGTVPDKVREHAAGAVDALAEEGFKWLGDLVKNAGNGRKR